jgi:acetyl/propionyl-CoA carboxylase alpha subunit
VYREPEGPGIRVDTGVTEGSDISVFYDPMVAKLITTGHNRDTALNTMGSALDRWDDTSAGAALEMVVCGTCETCETLNSPTGRIDCAAVFLAR